MAKYSEAIREIARAVNESNRIKKDDQYRQSVLAENIRSNKQNESIKREELTNRLTIAGAYENRAEDKTSDLEKELDVRRYGIKSTFDVGMDRNRTTRRGQDINKDIAYRGQNVTMRGQDITAGIAKMRDRTVQRGQNFDLDLGLRRDSTVRRGQDFTRDLGILGYTTQMRGQDLDYDIGKKRIESAKEITGMNIKARKDLQDDQQDWASAEGKAAREHSEIMQNKRLSITQKMNWLDNATKKYGIDKGFDQTKLKLYQQEKLYKMGVVDRREDVEIANYYEAASSEAQPTVYDTAKGAFGIGVKEGRSVDAFNTWHEQNQAPGLDDKYGVLNKAKMLGKYEGPNDYTQNVIATYEDAFQKMNETKMGTALNLGGQKSKIKKINQEIKLTLRPLYKAQGYTDKEVKKALARLKPGWHFK